MHTIYFTKINRNQKPIKTSTNSSNKGFTITIHYHTTIYIDYSFHTMTHTILEPKSRNTKYKNRTKMRKRYEDIKMVL